jgi:CO dehydrogenase/acetyl-CoA synthase beta subunit
LGIRSDVWKDPEELKMQFERYGGLGVFPFEGDAEGVDGWVRIVMMPRLLRQRIRDLIKTALINLDERGKKVLETRARLEQTTPLVNTLGNNEEKPVTKAA